MDLPQNRWEKRWSKGHPLREKLSINSMVQGGELQMYWGFSTAHFDPQTIEELGRRYVAELEGLIEHCLEVAKRGSVYTPSDYGLGAEISYEALDEFLRKKNKGTQDIMEF